MSTLKNQAVKSIKWTSIQTITAALTGPVALIVKSWYLLPEGFAHLAIILIVIGLFKLLENFGISQAIIQKDHISISESSSIFWFNIFFAAFSAIVIFLSAPFIAAFYKMPALEQYLKLASTIVFINGPSLLFRAFLEKSILFKQLSIINIARNIINLATLITFLYLGLDVAGVVYAHIISTASATIMIIGVASIHTPVKLTFFFKTSALYPFIRFGAFVSGKQLLTYITHRVDELVIGYLMTPDILGIYHFGKQMLEKIRGIMTKSFAKVLFPVFSQLKNHKTRLSNAYQQVSKFIAHGAFPLFTGIAITAHLFVPVVFGEKWIDSVIVFQVFSISMIFLLLTANISSSLLYSLNKPELVFYIDVITNSIYFISLFLFASHGLIAILVVYSAYILYKTLTLQYYTNKHLMQKLNKYLQNLALPALLSIGMALMVMIFQHLSTAWLSDVALLIGSILIGGAVFAGLSFIFARDITSELKKITKVDKI